MRAPLTLPSMRLVFLALAMPCALQAQDVRTRAIDDTLVLHYVGHAIGRETYRLTPSDSGWSLNSDFDYRDRGRRTHVAGAMQLARNFAPLQLEIARLTDTSRTIDT